ncbi:unnamed protein product [Brassica oleracea var. botrytis]|uniref:Uncharacterized protein n=1 Tax=Brassica oleracea TaxID=3712 RepID=A0A3P6FSF6_BRAOL|nr:unnamed protein product [Brassica oleracea]
MRISGFLAQSSLTCYLVKLTVDAMENSSIDSSRTKVVQSLSYGSKIKFLHCHDVPKTLLMNDPSLLF